MHFPLKPFFLILAINLLTTSPVYAHGAGSGNEGNFCRIHLNTDELMVSSYQPEVSKQATYCTDLPTFSESIIVLDFMNPSLRKKPLSAQIIQLSGDQAQTEAHEHYGEIVTAIPFNAYKTGTVELTFTPQKGSQYAALITILDPDGHPETVDFPLTFGKPSASLTPFQLILSLLLVAALASFFSYLLPTPPKKSL
jgi:hypothetical protein